MANERVNLAVISSECSGVDIDSKSEYCLQHQRESLRLLLRERTAELTKLQTEIVARNRASRKRSDLAATGLPLPWTVRLREGGLCPANISNVDVWSAAVRGLAWIAGEEGRGGLLFRSRLTRTFPICTLD